jgi:protein-tyrosine phosphatase
MRAILDAIDDSLDRDLPVYVHCWGGHGRTATVVGCWLVRHGMSGDEALRRIAELRRAYPELRHEPAPQANVQYAMVGNWKPRE